MKDKHKTLLYIGISLALFVLALVFDRRISLAINSWHTARLDLVMIYLKDLLVGYVVLAVLSVYLLITGKGKWVPVILMCMVSADLTAHILKHLFPRARPWDVLPIAQLDRQVSLSFPSGHVTFLIALVPVLKASELKTIKWLRYLKGSWIVYALLIGLNRVYTGAHFASDVVAGFVLGYLVGYGWVWGQEKHNIFEKPLLRKGWPIIIAVMLLAMAILNWWTKIF